MGENTNSDILDLGGWGGKSSTVTTRHITASQNRFRINLRSYCGILMQRISEKCDVKLLTENENTYLFHFCVFPSTQFCIMQLSVDKLNTKLWWRYFKMYTILFSVYFECIIQLSVDKLNTKLWLNYFRMYIILFKLWKHYIYGVL